MIQMQTYRQAFSLKETTNNNKSKNESRNKSQNLFTLPLPTNPQQRTPPQTTLVYVKILVSVKTLVTVKKPPSKNVHDKKKP